ncbi:hypothetical protein [Paenochrobactrum pullorum]|uniref:hypothetical protein n=1 Tax=Paenochrobactrum pullorum TaxID=1324351 RepID=UPI0035BC2DF5
MKILQIRPAPFGVGEKTLALFDVELSPECRIFNLALRKNSSGQYRIVSPNSQGRHVVTFSKNISAQLTEAAVAALHGGQVANVRNRFTA